MKSRNDKNPQRFTARQLEFIESQVRGRLGRFRKAGDTPLCEAAREVSSDLMIQTLPRPLLYFEFTGGQVDEIFRGRENGRNYQFIEYLKALDCPAGTRFLADFGDNIAWDYRPLQELGIPIFSKSRPCNPESNVILWTHDNYRMRREEGIRGDYSPCSWEEKRPEFIWRGAANASVRMADGYHFGVERLFNAMQDKSASGSDEALIGETFGSRDFKEIMNDHSYRFRLVHDYGEVLDVRFVRDKRENWVEYQDFLEANGYRFGDRIDGVDIARNKYLLVLGGGDAGSQIHWALSSLSVILMPPIVFYSTTTLGLKAWEHYVPVAPDLSDLEEKIEWCIANDDNCREIAENAKTYVSQFEPAIEDEINQRVLDHYCYAVQGGFLKRSLDFLLGRG